MKEQVEVVIITGASSGIGEATVKLLASKGAKAALATRRENHLQKISSDIKGEGGEAFIGVTNVTKPEDDQKS
ncbi:SDR family NAD(P)-dependent oxidoreductase [Salibacterium aidingense]|uniref:SDR family NAD(P)-dependent oxidoreductase n=1 Tax=Salibacterium aidingense TaxID=384933 RepID=UPI0004014B70|nr:SDR family NAD(P)-dependent oxidoreductase [Salibacterium aidingense]